LTTRTALAFHNAQLEAVAFGDEFEPSAFEDLTQPKMKAIHKVRLRILNESSPATLN